jgi:hypothetical protein
LEGVAMLMCTDPFRDFDRQISSDDSDRQAINA